MCIRDRTYPELSFIACGQTLERLRERGTVVQLLPGVGQATCLLYTSDAADERSSVDLGGRRIIKKKNISVPVRNGRCG